MNEIMMGAKFYIGVELAKIAEAAVIFVAVAIVYFFGVYVFNNISQI